VWHQQVLMLGELPHYMEKQHSIRYNKTATGHWYMRHMYYYNPI
jgi:hypothetical protein